ncbi:MAG: M28 family peptidase [Planctomycetes bacterium]|nr:M28 family peptidase [Planctomycetota bacterium]MBI3846507.1 M28 family peptidase [Planctomycetota bacterium]
MRTLRRSSSPSFSIVASLVLLLTPILASASPSGSGTSLAIASINDADLSSHIYFLASDELEGRAAGTPGCNVAAEYIASELHRSGITPAGDDGTYFQNFKHGELAVKNVAGILPGTDPDLKREIVVIGGHYDHVGRGNFGSLGGPAARGQIHNGADDNASGTSAVLELAEAFSMQPARRSILFLLFTGEEMGLVGSKYYCEHPLLPLDDTVAMLNMDMVGRSKDGYLFIGGVGTSPAWKPLIDQYTADTAFHLEMKDGGRAPSDNSSFYSKNVPVLFFFTNVHEDYHRPSDHWDKINFAGEREIARLVFEIADAVGNSSARPKFTESGGYALPDSMLRGNMTGGPPPSTPFLGITFASEAAAGEGVPVRSVVEESGAAKAGVKEGDRIVAVDGIPVADSAALLEKIRTHKIGDSVKLEVRRGDETLMLEAVLGKRQG